jgi:hypothetical protein
MKIRQADDDGSRWHEWEWQLTTGSVGESDDVRLADVGLDEVLLRQ